MKRLAALVMALLCMCSFACAEETNVLEQWLNEKGSISELFADDTQITTVGEAEASAPIDIATLVFSVEAEGETVAEANQQVMASIGTIKDVIIAQGVDENQIWHRSYDVEPNVVYHNTKFTEEKVIDGYKVEIVLCVRLTDISLVGVVIDSALQSGARSTHELEFERSGAQDAYDQALAQAVQQAMHKAQKLAEGCGMELGDLLEVKELSDVEDGEARVEVTYSAR